MATEKMSTEMNENVEIHEISAMHQMGGLPKPKHPLVSVIHNRDIKNVSSLNGVKVINHLYTIIFKPSSTCCSFS